LIEVYRVSIALLEIVDRGEGEFVLKRAEDDAEPLVTIKFSAEARSYMPDNGLAIARVMLQAGFQAAAVSSEQVDAETALAIPPVLH
jgi:hypothetical protein